jgi:hypothetical protein
MLTKKALLSLGAAVAGTKLAQMVGQFDFDSALGNALGGIGLARRRSHIPENIAFLGIGIVVGGVAALLLAPASGEETRDKLSRKVDSLGDAASRKMREVREEMNGIAGRLGHETSAHEPA